MPLSKTEKRNLARKNAEAAKAKKKQARNAKASAISGDGKRKGRRR